MAPAPAVCRAHRCDHPAAPECLPRFSLASPLPGSQGPRHCYLLEQSGVLNPCCSLHLSPQLRLPPVRLMGIACPSRFKFSYDPVRVWVLGALHSSPVDLPRRVVSEAQVTPLATSSLPTQSSGVELILSPATHEKARNPRGTARLPAEQSVSPPPLPALWPVALHVKSLAFAGTRTDLTLAVKAGKAKGRLRW